MTNLKILLKNNFNIFLGTIQGKKKRKSTTAAVSVLILGIVGIYALYTFQAFSMFKGLGELGLYDLCVFHGIITTLSVLTIIAVMRSSGTNMTSDTDLLLSLPICKKDIVISKTVNKYIFDLFFSFALLTPFLFLYLFFAGFNWFIFVSGFFIVFFLPLMTIGISYICDFLITRIFNRSKHSALLKSMFSVLILVLVMGFLLVKTFGYGSVSYESMNAYFIDRPLANTFLNFILFQKIDSIFICLGVMILPFIIGMILFICNFGKSFSSSSSKTSLLVFKENKGCFKSMFRKEIGFYATTPAWVVNTIIGPIFILVFAIVIGSMGVEKVGSLIGIDVPITLLVGFTAVIFSFFIATATITSSSFSLEGKNLWILKSSPVKEQTLFLAKSMLGVVIILPFVLLSSIIVSICLKLSFVDFLIILTIPTLANLILSVAGVFINLWLPKLEWSDPTQPVKQGLATLVTMILGISLALIPIGLYFLAKNLSVPILALITLGVYLIILFVFSFLLFTKGKTLYRKL